jgi:hypothetical protein
MQTVTTATVLSKTRFLVDLFLNHQKIQSAESRERAVRSHIFKNEGVFGVTTRADKLNFN